MGAILVMWPWNPIYISRIALVWIVYPLVCHFGSLEKTKKQKQNKKKKKKKKKKKTKKKKKKKKKKQTKTSNKVRVL